MWRWDGICLPEQSRTCQRVWSAGLHENRLISLASISHTWMLENGDSRSCKAGSPPYCCRAAVDQTVKSLIISAGRRCATTLLYLVRWLTPKGRVLNNFYCFNTSALGDLRPLGGKLTVYCVFVLCLEYLFASCFIVGFNSVFDCLFVLGVLLESLEILFQYGVYLQMANKLTLILFTLTSSCSEYSGEWTGLTLRSLGWLLT